MNALLNIRSSNLVLLIVLPIFVYLALTSSDYSRSFIAIIGAEPSALEMLVAFLSVVLPLSLGTGALFWHSRQAPSTQSRPFWIDLIIVAQTIGLVVITRALPFDQFINAIVVNAIDAVRSDEVIQGSTPWQLKPLALNKYTFFARNILDVAGGAILLLWVAHRVAHNQQLTRIAKWAIRLMWATNLLGLFYFLFVAHLGFASGLFLSIRAVIFAYLAASFMGIILAGLLGLKPKKRTFNFSIIAVLVFAASSFVSFVQPKQTYVLAGNAQEKIVLVKGTPSRMVDSLRHSDPIKSSGKPLSILSTSTVERAIKLYRERENVTGILIAQELLPKEIEAQWQADILPDLMNNLGFALATLALIGSILTFSGFQHGKHPIAIGAELFIDTIRGIPMLVIILYVGLPLAGNIRDISNGIIDMSGFWRGITAISIGYSAYMAEIFRAGIQSIPKGQLEAAQALGLSRWHTARFVILPQAIKVITPALGNEFIAMLKDTSLLSVLSVRDITQRMREFQASSFLPFAPFNTAAIVYVVLTLAIASALSSLERRQNRNTVR